MLCDLHLRELFLAVARKDGEQGIAQLKTCILKVTYAAARAASKTIKQFTMSQCQVLARMNEKQRVLDNYEYLDLSCNAFMDEDKVGSEPEGPHTLRHKSGWRITGIATSDYYCYCHTFKAFHKKLGMVWAIHLSDETNNCLMASSEEAMDDFWLHHGESIRLTDHGDI